MTGIASPAATDAALPPAALAGIRVLDLSGPLGNYCGKMFGDLGADVILVEPSHGSRLRFEPPFIDDAPGVERSLSFAYFNTSKRGVTLDLDTATGQAMFRRLVATADVVIESEKPGVMARRGLDYAALSAVKKSLVMTSITPFGQTGPYAHYEAEDLIALALGGFLYMGGYPDSPPMRVYGNQAQLCANMYGAVATMIGQLDAEQTGRGQHVDVSMHECVVLALENAVQFYDLEGTIRKRYAGEQRMAGTGIYPCKDGYICLVAGGIGGANKFWQRSMEWFIEEQVAGIDRLKGPEFRDPPYVKSAEGKRIFAEVFLPWAKTKTKNELFHEGQRRHIPIAPVNAPSDLLENRQLKHRSHFIEMIHPLRNSPLLMPGAPYRLSETPWRAQRRAPTLGEHNAEVYAEIGVAADDLAQLYAAGAL